MIGDSFNYKDVFLRDLTVCLLDKFEGEVFWINNFSNGNDMEVQVPFYYSMDGQDRFLFDAFSDDVVSDNRFTELNTDVIPRGHIVLTGIDIKSDEFANPNIWLRNIVEGANEIKTILSKIRAIPVSVKYNVTILLTSEIDIFKATQAVMDTLWLYRYMHFEHNYMNIDAIILQPDGNNIEINREENLTSSTDIKLSFDIEVHTYYPSFRKDNLDDPTNGGSKPYRLPTKWKNNIKEGRK